MRNRQRKTTPRVRDGKVRRKNRTDLSPDIFPWQPGQPRIWRERPGAGYRHLLHVRDVERFLGLLPDWPELSAGLRGVMLAAGEDAVLGWHIPGIVALCAWDRDLAGCLWTADFVAEHRDVLARLGVACDRAGSGGDHRLAWTERSAAGFQLMNVLLHELGHHHDRMTTRSQARAARGEPYADAYALRHADRLWDAYFTEFGW